MTPPLSASADPSLEGSDPISNESNSEVFTSFGLDELLMESLAREGLTTPTPIQAMTIPVLLKGRDLVGLAQTGTGKTAAFLLPLLTHLNMGEATRPGGSPRALILAPTRELVIQIKENIRKLAADMNLRHMTVFGGARYDEQIRGLNKGSDIVVATPGRLEDLVKRGVFRFDSITHFILDEADHMLDLGFYPAIKRISSALPRPRQTMLFSATMPPEIRKLTAEFLTDPVEVKAPQSGNIAEKINQRVMLMPENDKREALTALLDERPDQQVLVFIRTKRRADTLSRAMARDGYAIDALHGDMNQRLRQKVLNKFRRGELKALIATDVAARGIDVAGIGLVVNFDLTDTPEAYVHRIGRTGRAGLAGLAISFCAPDERRKLRPIMGVAGGKLIITDADGQLVADIPSPSRGDRPGGRGGKGMGRGRPPKRARSDGPSRGDRARPDKPRSDRPRSDKPRSDKPSSYKPWAKEAGSDDSHQPSVRVKPKPKPKHSAKPGSKFDTRVNADQGDKPKFKKSSKPGKRGFEDAKTGGKPGKRGFEDAKTGGKTEASKAGWAKPNPAKSGKPKKHGAPGSKPKTGGKPNAGGKPGGKAGGFGRLKRSALDQRG
jgi:ATP-dependent RNA helicase RhlE